MKNEQVWDYSLQKTAKTARKMGENRKVQAQARVPSLSSKVQSHRVLIRSPLKQAEQEAARRKGAGSEVSILFKYLFNPCQPSLLVASLDYYSEAT